MSAARSATSSPTSTSATHQCGVERALDLAAKLAARRLIGISDLESAVRWSQDLAEQADVL